MYAQKSKIFCWTTDNQKSTPNIKLYPQESPIKHDWTSGNRKKIIFILVVVTIQIICFSNHKTVLSTIKHEESIYTKRLESPEVSKIQDKYQNPEILEKGCSITVVLYDPNISEKAIWTLESAADHIYPRERVCFLLQTSICLLHEDKEIDTDKRAFQAKAQDIQSRAKPHFLSKIEKGNVRMSILDTKKYHLTSCSNFYSPNQVWLNYHYWGSDEFISEDSDTVLIIQDDAVLCHALHVDKWNDLAYVGAPWPFKGFCTDFPKFWKDWHVEANNTNVPDFPTKDEICTKHEVGPVGNGGLSLRSRKWMQKAISYCPNRNQISGLTPEEISFAPCNAHKDARPEDVFYAVILRGLGAPMPSVYEASLFSMEMDTTLGFELMYKLTNKTELEEMVQYRWWSPEGGENGALEKYRQMRRDSESDKHGIIISIGVHKYLDKGGDYTKQHCPYSLQGDFGLKFDFYVIGIMFFISILLCLLRRLILRLRFFP